MSLRSLGESLAQVGKLDGFASQLPLVPLVRLDDVRLVEVCVRLRSHLVLRDWLLNHLAGVFSLKSQKITVKLYRSTDEILISIQCTLTMIVQP